MLIEILPYEDDITTREEEIASMATTVVRTLGIGKEPQKKKALKGRRQS